jgi:hypothetical protein
MLPRGRSKLVRTKKTEKGYTHVPIRLKRPVKVTKLVSKKTLTENPILSINIRESLSLEIIVKRNYYVMAFSQG